MLIELFLIGMFLAGLSNITFGFLVYSKNKKSPYGKTFLMLSLTFAIWAISYAIWLTKSDAESALLWSRMLNLGATLIPVFFLHFVLSFLGQNKTKKNLLRFGYISTILFSFLSFSPGYVTSVIKVGGFSFWPQAGPIYTIFLVINFIFLFGYALLLLADAVFNRKLPPESMMQGRYILFGSLISVIGGSANFPLMYGYSFPAYLSLLSIFHPFFWSYGAIKYQFFNVKVLSSQLLVFMLWMFLLIRTFISETIEEQIISGVLLVVTVIVGLLLIQSVVKEVKAREKIEKLAKELKQANKKLEEMGEQKSQFLSIASHQFRSPLTAIKGYTSLILEGSYGEIPEKIKEPISNIYASAQNLVIVVEDFLNISRIEQGRMEYNFEKTDVGKLVAGIVEEIRPVAEQRNLKFDFKAPAGETFFSNIDANKMRQVIINTIDNSAKYTPAGWIKVSIDKHDGKILISVADSGVGISKENIGKLFTMFTRTGNAHKVNVMGTGLGLYVAKQIVEAQGGRIWAESPGEGKGSTFFVELKEVKV